MKEVKSRLTRFLLLSLLMVLAASAIFYTVTKLKFEENLSNVLPVNRQSKFLIDLLDNASFFDRMIVHIYTPDSTEPSPNELVKLADKLSDSIQQSFIPEYILSIEGKTSPDIQQVLFTSFTNNLPFYLEEADYQYIDSLIVSNDLSPLVKEHLKVLNSPAGFMASRYLFSDPLGLITKQYSRLEYLQVDDNLIVYKNYLLSKNKRHLTFFLTPSDAGNTGKNAAFLKSLDQKISSLVSESTCQASIEYMGSLPIASANAKQIKRDIQLTINMAILVIVLLILYFYRRWQYLPLVLLPAFIGASFALAIFTFSYGKISAISLGIGSVLLGISVDYALHIFTHLKHSNNLKSVIKDVTLPILMSSLTTGSAFLGLLALSSSALRQLGVFAAISVVISALIAVFILPLLLNSGRNQTIATKSTFIESFATFKLKNKKWNLLTIGVLTFFFVVFIPRVKFEDDFEQLSYMSKQLKLAEKNLDKAGDFSGKKSYLLSEGNNLDEAITNSKIGVDLLDSLKSENVIDRYNTILPLVASKQQQSEKIARWNSFWGEGRTSEFNRLLSEAASKNHIKPNAYHKFTKLLDKNYSNLSPDSIIAGFDNIASSFKLVSHDKVYIAHVIHLDNKQRAYVSDLFKDVPANFLIDKKVFVSSVFQGLEKDFRILLYISLIIVFVIILIFLGRIELALVTFLPILISWLWTLGFIGLFQIKLNFFNIVVCSLIFGLGIDYAIFISRGLMQKYKTGENKLTSYKSSILLSGITTLVGLGVLLLAKHPALKSIAALAIVGIVSSIVISFILQPILFNFLIESKGKKRRFPITFISTIFRSKLSANSPNRVKQNFIYKGPVLEHYIKIKLRLEKNYLVFNRIVPTNGKIYDIGCGYGTMAMMLKMYSGDRTIIGLDYDEEKIATAKNTELNQELGIHFKSGDALELEIIDAKCILLSDMLHYLTPIEQEQLLTNCCNNLYTNGVLIIRDGDSAKQKRHKGTKLSEFFSTNIGFNKTRNSLNFFPQSFIESFARKHQLSFRVIDESKHTSNLIYVLTKK